MPAPGLDLRCWLSGMTISTLVGVSGGQPPPPGGRDTGEHAVARRPTARPTRTRAEGVNGCSGPEIWVDVITVRLSAGDGYGWCQYSPSKLVPGNHAVLAGQDIGRDPGLGALRPGTMNRPGRRHQWGLSTGPW